MNEIYKNFIEQLDCIFNENMQDKTFDYSKQGQRLKAYSEYEDAFNKEAVKYTDHMRPLYDRGGEEQIRRELAKIENEIREKLKKDKRFRTLIVPDHLISRLRIVTQGYDNSRNPIIP